MFGFDRCAARYTWTAVLVLLSIGVVYLVRETLLVFTIALLFAYLLYPLVDLLDRFLPSRSRAPALAIVYVGLIGLLVILGISVGSKVADEANALAQKAPDLVAKLNPQQRKPAAPQAVESVKSSVVNGIEDQLRANYSKLVSALPSVGLKILGYSKNLIYLVIVPILSFFILKDGRTIRDDFLDLMDKGHSREVVTEIMGDVHLLLLQYMRALLLLCLATFTAFSITFSIMGVPYGILLATIAFPLEFIPLVGPLAAAVIIIAVVAFSGASHLLGVIIFLGCYRMFQDYVLSPNLMSKGIELHPMLVIFGVFAGGEIGGIAGTFLSVPVLALVRIVYHRMRKKRVVSPPTLVTA